MRYKLPMLFVVLILAAPVSLAALDDGLAGYWKMDSGSGSTAFDDVGGEDGDITGASWTTAKFKSGLYFDGSGDYVALSDWRVFDGSSSVSVSTWINPSSLSYSDDGHFSNHAQLVGKQGQGSDDNYELALLDTGEAGVYVDNGNNIQVTGGSIDTGSWYHVVSTYGDGQLELYVNGDRVASSSASGSLVSNTHPLEFGGDSGGNYGGGNYYWYDGKMDEIRIYSRELSSSEVQDLYQYSASICDRRGSENECIVDSEKDLSGKDESIDSVFISESSSIFNAPSGQADISVSNSSFISGLWFGDFNLSANTLTIEPGAEFRPEERIIIEDRR